MWWRKLLILPLLFLLLFSRGEAKEIDRTELNFATALISMSSYSAELNLLAREWLQDFGWVIDSHEYATALADGRVHIMARQFSNGEQIYVLAFPGTERKQDAIVDLRVTRVPFGGQTPAEFSAVAAAVENKSGANPLVHQGFNDYTQAALFSEPLPEFGSLTLGEVIARDLRTHPSYTLYLTGHSLGGAAATLAAARLADMGVSPQQLRVITFGAPAVGNTAFARAYEKRMQLTRITMEGDPVKAALQSLSGGYVQFGEKVVWSSHLGRFPHDMTLYLDEALRHYQDSHGEDEQPLLVTGKAQQTNGLVYAAPFQFELGDRLNGDKSYMKRVVQGILKSAYQPLIFGQEGEDPFEAARKQGAKFILVERFQGKRIKNEEENYRLTLEEEIYDGQGNLLTFQSYSMTASTLTPLEAVGYLTMKADAEREKLLTDKK
jgi:pimeloyl-ACP methyl ester carboxylesterase